MGDAAHVTASRPPLSDGEQDPSEPQAQARGQSEPRAEATGPVRTPSASAGSTRAASGSDRTL